MPVLGRLIARTLIDAYETQTSLGGLHILRDRDIVDPATAATNLLPVPDEQLVPKYHGMRSAITRLMGGREETIPREPAISRQWLYLSRPYEKERRDVVERLSSPISDDAITSFNLRNITEAREIVLSYVNELGSIDPNSDHIIDMLNGLGLIVSRGIVLPPMEVAVAIWKVINNSNKKKILDAAVRFLGNVLSVSPYQSRVKVLENLIRDAVDCASRIELSSTMPSSKRRELLKRGEKLLFVLSEVIPILSWSERKALIKMLDDLQRDSISFSEILNKASVRRDGRVPQEVVDHGYWI